jgi:hypothetical protein
LEALCEFAANKKVDIDELIDGYLGNRLSQKETDDFEVHILECEECYQKLYVREQTIAVVHDKGDVLFADLIHKERQKWRPGVLRPVAAAFSALKKLEKLEWGYAAALVAASILAIVLITGNHEPQRLSEHFRPHVYFDELIANQEYRRASENLRLLSPDGGASFRRGERILFHWLVGTAAPANLRILNNKGEKLYSYAVQADQFAFKEDLTPGLYYWKIESNDDFRLGKFYVDQR